MSLQAQDQFYEWQTRVRSSRAASTQAPKEDVLVTEMMDGLIVSRPTKKYQEITNTKTSTQKEAEVIDLQEYAKSKTASVQVNKLQEILKFQRSNGRI